MAAHGAWEERMQHALEVIEREMIDNSTWLLAMRLDIAEKAEFGLAAVIAATHRLYTQPDESDYHAFDRMAKAFASLRDGVGRQNRTTATGSGIFAPIENDSSNTLGTRRSTTIEPTPIDATVDRETEDESVPVKEEVMTDAAQAMMTKVSPKIKTTTLKATRIKATRIKATRIKATRIIQRSRSNSGSESAYAAEDGPSTQPPRGIKDRLANSSTPCMDLLLDKRLILQNKYKTIIKTLVNLIVKRNGDKEPQLHGFDSQAKHKQLKLLDLGTIMRSILADPELNESKARRALDEKLRFVVCLHPHCFPELGKCAFVFVNMMQSITNLMSNLAKAFGTIEKGVVRSPKATAWYLEVKLRKFAYRNRRLFPELRNTTLAGRWMALSDEKW
ncbi:uncharacterized protein BDZ99DRAFT_570719 [Mytilinidion resinicola]|uniref:Uncharacterized protein n=1 Tax=Mytilinidion resinicola TaxID=574789 RepID=A0A6A6YMJ2_9PEZI|nr:uncharacterized protein BDZ99DRAFT_570719 [Mytilinidion resinicola]KAF2810096.1 hypothetical protein BDZ99DRAFT_570719 [Mytilinidion resinicola]